MYTVSEERDSFDFVFLVEKLFQETVSYLIFFLNTRRRGVEVSRAANNQPTTRPNLWFAAHGRNITLGRVEARKDRREGFFGDLEMFPCVLLIYSS